MNEDAVRKVMATLGIAALNKSAKGWVNARCPLAPWTHKRGEDRTPAFAIKVNEEGVSSYTCMACHYKGRLSQLVRTLSQFRGHDYGSLALDCDMYDMAGVFGSGFECVPAGDDFEEPMTVDESMIRGLYPPAMDVPEAAAYLDRRGISFGTAQTLGLCFDPDDMRVLFPVRSRTGELYGFTGRSVLREEDYLYRDYPKIRDYLGLPKRAVLLGLELWQPGKPAFAVEGLIGYASLVEQGVRDICNPVALMGSEMTPQKASLFAQLDEPLYLMTDPDAAGEACLWGRIDPRTGDHDGFGAVRAIKGKSLPLYVPPWPDGKDDPDQLDYQDVSDILARCPLFGWEV